MAANGRRLGELIDRVEVALNNKESISIGELVQLLGGRSHFALLFVIAATAATPLSGIPGVSIICGLLIAMISLERLFSRGNVYLPGKLRHRSIKSDPVKAVISKARPLVDWIDRHTRKRFEFLFHRPMIYVPLLICVLSGLAMPFLELVPFTSSVVASGVLVISIAFVTRDGAIALLALAPYGGAVYLAMRLL